MIQPLRTAKPRRAKPLSRKVFRRGKYRIVFIGLVEYLAAFARIEQACRDVHCK